MPVIAKITHADTISTPEGPFQNYYGGTPEKSVERAYVARGTAIGITVYFGLPADEFRKQVELAGRAISRAKELGMPVILWAYVRGTDPAVNKVASTDDVTSQANHMAATLGADIIKQKIPEQGGGFLELKKKNVDPRFYETLTTENLTNRVRIQVWGSYLGQTSFINSGGASTGKGILADAIDAVWTAFGNLLGGGTGEIMGRKAFQKLMEDGAHLIHLVQSVYLLAVPEEKLNARQGDLLKEVGGTGLHGKYHPLIARLAIAA